ncbi:MAG: ATP-binding protein [Candidatus Nanohaloarchaea archaeon]|nr:ATP-binding protein [Candidatus Nanohaloarchaea archaeon]
MGIIEDAVMMQRREAEDLLDRRYIDRDTAVKGRDSDLVKVIMGPRRSGKSTLALHTAGQNSFAYLNFDDEVLSEVEDYNRLLQAADEVYGDFDTLLLDEVQNLPKWELFVNRLQRQGYDLIVTGSNSKLLSRELATHLTGRHLPTYLFPLSFPEFMRWEKSDRDKEGFTSSEKKALLKEYIEKGGFPEPLVKEVSHTNYLKTLLDNIVYNDIVKRHDVRSYEALENLAVHLLSNIARPFSYNALKKATKVSSVETVENYLGYLEEAFLLFTVRRFSYKTKEHLRSKKKVYSIDPGFVHAKGFKVREDMGRLYENLVAVELKKRALDGGGRLFYYKNDQGHETDFVVKENEDIQKLIQVTYDISDEDTRKREIRGLINASKNLRCKNLLVITGDYEAVEQVSWHGTDRKIEFIPLWKWLLKE